MKSYQLFTNEIDDLDLAVAELRKQYDLLEFTSNTGGILYCGSEVDSNELCQKLWTEFHLPFIGTTCIGQFTNHGYSEASICLNLFTGEDISFSGGLSGDLTSENMAEEVKEAYHNLKERMDKPETAIVLYIPWVDGVVYDDILNALTEASGGIPIFGGVCSDEWEFDNTYAMCSMGSFTNRAAMLLVGGNFNPIFYTTHSINSSANVNTVTVTKASGATVYEIDGKPANEYFKSIGLHFEYKNIFVDSLANPMKFTYTTPEGDHLSILRNLYQADHETGSITFAGGVPENAQMSLALTSMITIRSSIKEACVKIFEELIQDSEREYSCILVSSCTGRYCLSVANKDTECGALKSILDDKILVSGGYMNGEFCPVMGNKTGKYYNLLNNETFTIMVF